MQYKAFHDSLSCFLTSCCWSRCFLGRSCLALLSVKKWQHCRLGPWLSGLQPSRWHGMGGHLFCWNLRGSCSSGSSSYRTSSNRCFFWEFSAELPFEASTSFSIILFLILFALVTLKWPKSSSSVSFLQLQSSWFMCGCPFCADAHLFPGLLDILPVAAVWKLENEVSCVRWKGMACLLARVLGSASKVLF